MFSTHEKMILKALGKRKMSIAKLTEKFYKTDAPLGANNYVAGVVRRINDKCVFNKLNWCIAGRGIGRSGRTVWRQSENH